MEIMTYTTDGGKDLILDFLDSLPKDEAAAGYKIINLLSLNGLDQLQYLNTRQIEGRLWEIKFQRHNRIFYAVWDKQTMYILHACKKQKDKAEKFELEKARKRMREITL